MQGDDLPVGIVLAGGLARRMGGGDKPLRLLGGRTLLDHTLARLRPQVRGMALNANGDPARFAPYRLPVVADTLADFPGPLAGVLAGMRWAQHAHPQAGYVVSVPGDTPFLPDDLAARLMAARAAAGVPIACAASGGRVHPVAALWRVELADALEAALRADQRRVMAFVLAQGMAEVAFARDPDWGDPFFNVNTPEDLLRAEALFSVR
ncbi:MAG TPA: molybdenum cofactor guanylyltransferase MobA [Acetobacteraceae bacterium]|jgi:molybdopterin-guanine dinucleotide biosynthesis protein A